MKNMIQVCVVGGAQSGKTQLCNRLQTPPKAYTEQVNSKNGAFYARQAAPGTDQQEVELYGSIVRNTQDQSRADVLSCAIFLYCVPVSTIDSNATGIIEEIEQLRARYPYVAIFVIGTKTDESNLMQQEAFKLFTRTLNVTVVGPFLTSAKDDNGIEALKSKLFSNETVAMQQNFDSLRAIAIQQPLPPKPSRRLRYLAITSLALAPIALSIFLTVSLSVPAALPALATVLPFLLLVSPLAAGFIAGGLVAAVFLLIAATTELVFRRQQNHMELPSGDNQIRKSSSFDNLPVSSDLPAPEKPFHGSDPLSATAAEPYPSNTADAPQNHSPS